MNKRDKDGAGDAIDPALPSVTSEGTVRLLTSREKTDRRHRERAVIDDEMAVLHRENMASTREDAAHVRENAAHLREGVAHAREGKAGVREEAATAREQEIRAAVTLHTASDDHMVLLQQVNARLVIATIDAQKLTEQVQLATAEMETAKSAAEKANLAKSDFLSKMSHELRTPLNAILGFTQLLEASSPPPTAIQAIRLQHIIKAGWYLLELINEILDLAVIESGRVTLSQQPVRLAEVMAECQAMIESQAQKYGIQVNFIPCDPSWLAHADHTRVKQVLLNLLSNAIKYNREHGSVEVQCSVTPDYIRISIKDSGEGLPPEKLAQLFQAFNRLGQENSSEEGTGIGLVVTKQLVELMGGAIGVESTVGVGSEFWIELRRYMPPQLNTEK